VLGSVQVERILLKEDRNRKQMEERKEKEAIGCNV
jgi:hypothetical protein